MELTVEFISVMMLTLQYQSFYLVLFPIIKIKAEAVYDFYHSYVVVYKLQPIFKLIKSFIKELKSQYHLYHWILLI